MTVSLQTLYMRPVFPTGLNPAIVLPSGALTSTDYVQSNNVGGNIYSLLDVPGQSTQTVTLGGSLGTGASPKTYLNAGFASPPLKAQSIGSGTWTVGYPILDNSNTVPVLTGYIGIYLVDGTTGAIKTTIAAAQTLGTTRTTAGYVTAYDAAISGASATAAAGDYLVIEIGIRATFGGAAASQSMRVRFGNNTAISSDNVSNTAPASFISAPAALDFAASDLFLLSANSSIDPGAGQEKQLDLTRGGTAQDYVTTTTASGTLIQATDSGGGTALVWYSPPLDAVTLSGQYRANLRGKESGGAVNATRSMKVEITDGPGTSVLSTVLATSVVGGQEFTTTEAANLDSNGELSIAGTVAVAQGSRIKITLYVSNVGTMGAGTVTYSVNGPTAGSAGDSYIRFWQELATTWAATFPAAVATVSLAAPSASVAAAALLSAVLATIATAAPDATITGATGAISATLLAEVAAVALAAPDATAQATALLATQVAALSTDAPSASIEARATLLASVATVALDGPTATIAAAANYPAALATIALAAPIVAVLADALLLAEVATVALDGPTATLTASAVLLAEAAALSTAAPAVAALAEAVIAASVAGLALAAPDAAITGESTIAATLLAQTATLAIAAPLVAFTGAATLLALAASIDVAAPAVAHVLTATLAADTALLGFAAPTTILRGDSVLLAALSAIDFNAPPLTLQGAAALLAQVGDIGLTAPPFALGASSLLALDTALLALDAPAIAALADATLGAGLANIAVVVPPSPLTGGALLIIETATIQIAALAAELFAIGGGILAVQWIGPQGARAAWVQVGARVAWTVEQIASISPDAARVTWEPEQSKVGWR